ncbi:MAG: malate synthase [Microbacteriaceae bacterium]|nr:malate synthase [Microbacteriaceae bacterium]
MTSPTRIEVRGTVEPRFDEILTPEALGFLTRLHDAFAGRRHERLAARMHSRTEIDLGHNLHFLAGTEGVRNDADWRVAGAGPGLEDRRVELTSPADAHSAAEALASDAQVWIADFEDALSPTWSNIIGGQIALHDAIRSRTTDRPTIAMRPRGWHLAEKHLRYVDRAGQSSPASATLVDFGLYFFHNAAALVAAGSGPYFYLPKLENHLEARLWDDVFSAAEAELGLDRGTIRATVQIETIPAAFEMEEILYELRDHCAGLNAARWDYIFSIIKNFRGRGVSFTLPDRSAITMTTPFLRAYTELLVSTCHRRGAYAIGGLATHIPERAGVEGLAVVAADKRREASDGFDGTWVAHPGLVGTALAEFDAVLDGRTDQLDRQRDDVTVTAADLLDLTVDGQVTDAGVRANVSSALRYIEAWLRGVGAVAIDDRIEDAATAELSRAQLWQWIHHRTVTVEGSPVTRALVTAEVERILQSDRAAGNRFAQAAEVFGKVTLETDFPTFITVAAYPRHLVTVPRRALAAA